MIKSALDIKEVLKDFLKYTNLGLSEDEWDLLLELYSILSPVKDVVNVICRRNSDLLIAETSFKYLFEVLEKNPSPLAAKLLANLKIEIEKRWNPRYVSLLKYLNDPSELSKVVKSKRKPSTGMPNQLRNNSISYKLYFLPYIL